MKLLIYCLGMAMVTLYQLEKYNVTELIPLPSINDVNGRLVAYQASFSSDFDSTIRGFPDKDVRLRGRALE